MAVTSPVDDHLRAWRLAAKLFWMVIGVLIFIRRSNDLMAWLVSLFLVVFGLATFDSVALDALAMQHPSLALPVGLVKFAGEVLIMSFLLFPSGRFAPGWMAGFGFVMLVPIAALFSPLRKRVQEAIDRRFYRRKYDAAQTLAAFATTARDEVDLEVLTAELLHTVKATMQPSHLSLWLHESWQEP